MTVIGRGVAQRVEIASGGSPTIGGAVVGGTPNYVLFIDPSGNLGQDNRLTFNQTTGVLKTSANGAASSPALSITGAPFTGGAGTTTVPMIYSDWGATQPTTFSVNGTLIGANAATGFTGNFLDFRVNGGGSLASISAAGNLVAVSGQLGNLVFNNTTIFTGGNGQIILQSANNSVATAGLVMASGSYLGASVNQTGAQITPTVNQTGSAGFTALYVNPTYTAAGTGNQYLLSLAAGGASRFTVDRNGNANLVGAFSTSSNITLDKSSAGNLSRIQYTTSGANMFNIGSGIYTLDDTNLDIGSGSSIARFVKAGRVLINTTTDDGTNTFQVNGTVKSSSLTSAMTKAVSGVLTDAIRGYDYQGNVFSQTANKTITGTTETSIFTTGRGSLTIPANAFIAAGQAIMLQSYAIYGTGTGLNVPNITVNVKLNGTTIATEAVTNLDGSAANFTSQIWIRLICRSTGASGTCMVNGGITYETGLLQPPDRGDINNGTSTAALNTTIANTFDVTWTWSNGNAANTVTFTDAFLRFEP